MMPNGSFPRYRVDDSSYETECGHTNQCRPMEPLLRLALQRFRCIESDTAGEVAEGAYGLGKRTTIRPIGGDISCCF